VPAYREERRIGIACDRLARYFRKRRVRFEIIVVNDGSSDGTLAAARSAARRWREVRVISYARNRGKGGALRAGILASRGDRVLFLDADLSTRPGEWPKLERRLDRGADLAIGSRKMAGARLVRRQPLWRESMGKVFTWIVRRLLVNVSDVTCGFKALRGAVARDLFRRSRLDDWSFDAEVLYLAAKRGLRIDEVPVVWKDNPASKVRIVSATLGALAGLARIRWNDLLGRYGRG
jgi:dolichyl-phosphate beta-glucosyltransferase